MKDGFQDDFRSDDHCGDCARLRMCAARAFGARETLAPQYVWTAFRVSLQVAFGHPPGPYASRTTRLGASRLPWLAAAVQHHAQIRDSIETGVQQQIRDEPLESAQTKLLGQGPMPSRDCAGLHRGRTVAGNDQMLARP